MDGPCLARIPFKLLLKLMNGPEYEIFHRSSNMIYDFVSEVKAPPTGKVIDKLINLDEALEDVILLIHNHIKSLDKIKNKGEITFWNSQVTKLKEDVDKYLEIHVGSFEKDPEKNREFLERASQEALALKRVAGLDWKSFEKIKGYLKETEVSEFERNNDENLDDMETHETNLMVEDENKLDRKLDNNCNVDEKVNDISEAHEKEIDDKFENVSLDDILAPEAVGNDENE